MDFIKEYPIDFIQNFQIDLILYILYYLLFFVEMVIYLLNLTVISTTKKDKIKLHF